jgi:hypothetical protein
MFAAIRGNAALVFADGNVTSARGPAVELGEASARVETEGVTFDITLNMLAAGTAADAELHRSVQVCEVEGTMAAGGRPKSLHGLGLRTRSAPDPVGARRRRFVTAATGDGSLVSVTAVRPDPATPHGDELFAACEITPQAGNGAQLFEDVRFSTIYGPDGFPRKASAELYRPGSELPARMSGEAILGAPLELDGATLAITFFRWTVTGRPAWGTYEMEPAP